MRNSTQKNLIIDANNLLHRVFHVSKVLEKSTPTSHIYLFLNSLKSLVELFSPKKVICVWDYRKEDCYNFRKYNFFTKNQTFHRTLPPSILILLLIA